MVTEQEKVVVRRVFEEIWNQQRLDLIPQFYAEDFVDHDPTILRPGVGPEGVKQLFVNNLTAFPDMHFTIEDMVSEGDKIVTRWTAEGTHTGKYLNAIPPTGKRAAISGITISHMVDGKIKQSWLNYDQAGMMTQLGLSPDPHMIEKPVGKAIIWAMVNKNKIGQGLAGAVTGTLAVVGLQRLRRRASR
jgi:steroid delta-isomerase-like uncharacterized protein